MKEYQECNKLAAINDKRIVIKEFIEWCGANGVSFYDFTTNLDQVIFNYFDIDLEKIEMERQEILENARVK